MFWGVMLGGALGALSRYGINLMFLNVFPNNMFPWATFSINMIGSFVLSLLVFGNYWGLPAGWQVAIGTGLLGAFTTFSTFELETLRLLEGGKVTLAMIYMLASVLLGLLAALLGRWVALKLTG